MKSTHRKVLDAAHRLGLSQSVIKIIEMRTKQDKYIFWGLFTTTVLFMYFFFNYMK
ncbi:hypothetical protein ROZALSC1DRAFT_28362 [Rozella allomycis CSF55]|uniref:Uncharacterized protein n=1 Tax=Rozella allomycis (strain CSF55) TaxID=988480 RepID=A0A075B080_ROZAC|nr:hypothetical protein O9G_004807 [Rozella allomycis CSF55]RKP20128.1 hypothetical protein ROZALSC1DRAFT_28362 [Rozella allomycis CSF55]|eukprot:EPZ35988.1 hypothetical protein O9G_004807 [Rozella allomycis CSF55]